jgi:hypothetical protein
MLQVYQVVGMCDSKTIRTEVINTQYKLSTELEECSPWDGWELIGTCVGDTDKVGT